MLFNAPVFLFLFLPVTLAAYYAANRIWGWRAALLVLLVSSLAFYSNWNPPDLFVLAASTLFNYWLGERIAATQSRGWIALGVSVNLALLGVFKYADFIIANINATAGTTIAPWHLVLPLGISFYTFTQIAFLVDRRRGEAEPGNLFAYALFVVFFPHLIAGPIVHAAKLLPQFREPERARRIADNLAIGISIFLLGLAKKVLIADYFAGIATETFGAAGAGNALSFLDAWTGALCYTMQIYFDFSGYSDMAIGLSRMFGIDLPINFNSPYKATSIIEFWRRWHITLSQFLRDYLYIPLGGNRQGALMRYVNVLIVMLLGGFWHGANWTFVIWGAIHGTALLLNHLVRAVTGQQTPTIRSRSRLSAAGGWLATFLIVVVAWVFFRAENFTVAGTMLTAMFAPEAFGSLEEPAIVAALVAAMALVLVVPNTSQLFAREFDPYYLTLARIEPIGERSMFKPFVWNARSREAAALGLLATVIVLSLWRYSEFIYFQF